MKRFFALLLTAAMLCALPALAESGDPYAVTEPIAIEFWHTLSNDEVLNQLIDKFEEEHPLITVTPIYQGDWTDINTKMSAAISGKNPDLLPAVVTLNPTYVGTFAESGMVEPLDEYFANDGFSTEDFSAGLMGTFVWDGVQYGLPYLNSALVMFYNKDMAAAEGLEIPASWSEMDAFVNQAAANGHKAIGFHAGGAWYFESFFTNRLPCFGTDEEPVCLLNDPLCVEVASDLQRWYQEGKIDYFYGSSASADGRQAFINGDIFCYVQSSAIYQNTQKLCDFEIGMAFPTGGERGRYSHVGGTGIALARGARQEAKNAGWQLIKYLTSEEANLALAEATGYLPIHTTTLNSSAGEDFLNRLPALRPIIEHLDNLEYQPRYNNAVNCNDIWRAEMSRAILEGGDMQEVMESVTEQIREILEDN